MKCFSLILVVLAGCWNLVQAQESILYPESVSGNLEKGNFLLQFHPTLRLGTHINEVGWQISPSVKMNVLEDDMVWLRLTSTAKMNISYLGIPGFSFGLVNKAALMYGFGNPIPSFDSHLHFRQFSRHNITYYFCHFASTDGTSQFSGGIDYTFLWNKGLFRITMENDALAFLGLDEFRTGGGSLDYQFFHKGKLLGIGIGTMLWTGSTKGLTNLDFGQEYDMSVQYGAMYSHGILFLNFHYQYVQLSMGFDSEKIRMQVQDTLHKWIDDGSIPGGSQSRDRIFIQLEVYPFDFFY